MARTIHPARPPGPRRFTLVLLAAALGTPCLNAQTVAPVMTVGAAAASPARTLQQLVEELKRNNPQLRAARGTARAAQYGVEPALAPDNPTFTITQDPLRHNPFAIGTSTGMVWSLSQNLPWPGKRRLSSEIVQAQADEARAQAESLQVQLVGQLKAAWFSWHDNQAQSRLSRTQLDRLEQIKQITRLRYAQNAAAYADFINAQVTEAQLRTDLIGQERLAQTLAAQINSLIGQPAGTPLALSEQDLAPERNVPDLDALRQAALARNPALQASQYTIAGAQRSVELAELGSRPDFNVALSFTSAAPPWGFTNNDSYGISVGVTFPLYFDRKERHLIDQAKAQLGSVRDNDEALRQQAVLAVDTAYFQWAQSLEQLKLVEGRMLEQARVAYRMTLTGYGTGQTAFIDLVNAYSAMRGAELAALQARSAALQARVALDVAIGDL
jgi:cobalt-zinc-cadmium efflux system outer membrane protein